jgi:hypothetical protein
MAFLRFKVIRSNSEYTNLRSRFSELYKILNLSVETEAMEKYLNLLKELVRRYSLAEERDFKGMKDYRRHFAVILAESNSNIVQKHLRASSELVILLRSLSKTKSTAEQLQILETWYGNSWKDESIK